MISKKCSLTTDPPTVRRSLSAGPPTVRRSLSAGPPTVRRSLSAGPPTVQPQYLCFNLVCLITKTCEHNELLSVIEVGFAEISNDHLLWSSLPGAEAVTLSVSSPIQRHQTPPQTRQDLVQYLSVVTFDPNTASDWLLLSDDLKLVTNTHPKNQNYPKHKDRFTRQHQVLAIQEFAAGIHYWEVSVSGCSVRVGVAYRQINRTDRGSASIIGENEVSWCLELDQGSGIAWHDNRKSDPVPVPYQCLGLLLDFPCQTLSFYGIRDHAILLLHQFQTSFTQSLLPAFQISRQTRIQIENKTRKPERQIPIGNRS
ncbi:tripartite motif-containing protein 16-like protein [Rhincodon typus]|uniref:tripartite motif-containing protein 16-like protein n=1 Tax=Rhincodon typus TaxID=259920 RepID=UPI002030F558|nr:tripartite motif-containing protein 16-like protein [Rhincodon typus]